MTTITGCDRTCRTGQTQLPLLPLLSSLPASNSRRRLGTIFTASDLEMAASTRVNWPLDRLHLPGSVVSVVLAINPL